MGIDPGATNATRWPSSVRGHIMVAMAAQPAMWLTEIAPIARAQVVLPSSAPHDPVHLQAGIAWLSAAGVDVLPPRPRLDSPLRHLAGPDRLRAQELAEALVQTPIDIVWCGRGGSGALRTLAALEDQLVTASPSRHDDVSTQVSAQGSALFVSAAARRPHVPLIGLSDATALLLWRAFSGRPAASIHGPVITQLPRLDDASSAALKVWLRQPDILPDLRADRLARVGGTAEGVLIGGNLSLLAACAGTPQAISCDGCILLIEEVAEPAYRIDRMLCQLQRSGSLAGVVAVACGTFTDCPDPTAVQACLDHWAERLGVPWAGAFPVGHGPACWPVALGMRYRLAADDCALTPLQTLSEVICAGAAS